jgi:hypothetical protein
MRGFATFFADCFMLLVWNNCRIGLPEVSITGPGSVPFRDSLPEFTARRFTAITNHIRNDLTGFATEGNPYPGLLGFLEDK